MSLFASSLNTLKQRTSQLLENLDEQRTSRQERGSGSLSAGEDGCAADILAYGQQAAEALGCPQDSILVQYEVQNADDEDREPSVFMLSIGGAMSITLAMVRASFPPPGNYHFRFKAPTSDGSFGGWVWIDLASDNDFVPVFNGGIGVKALKLPGGFVAAPVSSMPFAAQNASQASMGSAPAPRAAPNGDLMELDLGGAAPRTAAAQAPAAPPKPAAPLDRAKLVADREARMKEEYDEKMRRHEEAKKKEEQDKKAKVDVNDKLSTTLKDWAKTPDGQSFKEIRTLLSTLHTVIWKDSGWPELPLSELVADSSIKKNYRKAILLAHPDRHQSASPEQQVRADRIFNALNESFKKFTSS